MTTPMRQQWHGVERTLKSGMRVQFKYDGHPVEVRKVAIGETKLAYVVIVNGCPLLGFPKEGEKNYSPLANILLRKRIINPHAAAVRRISAKRGGKSFLKQKENRWLTESKVEVTETFFPTAKMVVAHFRKIKGLEIVSPPFDMEVDNAVAC